MSLTQVHRIYIRWPNQKVERKTVTTSAQIAASEFSTLLSDDQYYGKNAIAVWTIDGTQTGVVRFEALRSNDLTGSI